MGSRLPCAPLRTANCPVLDTAAPPCLQQPFARAFAPITDPWLVARDRLPATADAAAPASKLYRRPPPASIAPGVALPSKPRAVADAAEQKKHRRTRSGCFTCRARRVKCDEKRPTCERCCKGRRECVYPPPQIKKPAGRANPKANDAQSSAKSKRCESPYALPAGAAKGEVEARLSETGSASNPPSAASAPGSPGSTRYGQQQWDLAFSQDESRSLSPQSDMARSSRDGFVEPEPTGQPFVFHRALPSIDVAGSLSLSNDDRLYLNYFLREVKPEHYFLRQHAPCFLHNDVLQRAFEYPPLMNAIMTFSAYLHSFRHADGRLYTFLHYYQSSLTGLLASLQRSEAHHDAMLLTVLQLATFEEYVGDWVNLMVHHQAACRMLKSLYSPAELTRDCFRRAIFFWVTRFDGASATVAGSAPLLGKEWYSPVETLIRSDIQKRPNDLVKKMLLCGLLVRKFNRDLAILLMNSLRSSVGVPNTDRLAVLEEMEPAIRASVAEVEYILKDIAGSQSADPVVPALASVPTTDDCAEEATAASIFADIARCRLDLLGSKLLYRYHVGSMLQHTDSNELTSLALEISRLIEMVSCEPEPAENILLSVQQALCLSVSFLPIDEPHVAWSRKKLAMVESQGYIFPQSLKSRLAALWGDPKVRSWWLPHGEGETQLLRETKEWAEEHSLDSGMSEVVHSLTAI